MPSGSRRRPLVFAAVIALLVGVAGAYVAVAALRDEPGGGGSGNVASFKERDHVVFQNVGGSAGSKAYARVALAAVDEPGERRVTTDLLCERVYFAAGRGLCLVSRQGALQAGYDVTITGADFERSHKLRLTGIPSRARISPDGRYGATTGFVAGHSYASDNFSTQTVLIDMDRGKVIDDLEKDFTVTRDGKRIKDIDFNFWGVTFAKESGRFYATLRTGDDTFLLEGDMRTRQARVLHKNVECPSLSPDNTRIAYKKWLGDRWHLYVLDLATMKETPLAEERPVDDQVEWLDDKTVLYGLSPDVWAVPADGGGAPRRFLSRALSPAVVRG